MREIQPSCLPGIKVTILQTPQVAAIAPVNAQIAFRFLEMRKRGTISSRFANTTRFECKHGQQVS